MVNRNLMDELNNLGFGADVDALETYVINLQNADADGNPEVDSKVYEKHLLLLKQLKPSSIALMRDWESAGDAGVTDGTEKYTFEELRLVKSMGDLSDLRNKLSDEGIDFCARASLIGRDIRAIYKRGRLVAGSTAGVNGEWRDIIRHLRCMLPTYIEAWESYKSVEVSGVVVINDENFKQLSESLKTKMSAITHILRDDATEAELSMIHCICHSGVIEGGWHIEDEIYDEITTLGNLGFNIPKHINVLGVDRYNFDEKIEGILNEFEDMHDKRELAYDCDGVVVHVNDIETLNGFGRLDGKLIGAFIIKMGRVWESNKYKSIVTGIRWEGGKEYYIPIALIKPVITVTGVEVTEVKLQSIGVMERLHLRTGSEIHFRYDGKNGVRLCDDKTGQI